MTEDRWIVDPDPTTLRIGQACEARMLESSPWRTNATLQGYSGSSDAEPWWVKSIKNGERYWAAHIRVKRPIRYGPVSTAGAGKVQPPFDDFWGEVQPYALVPMTQEDADRLRNMTEYGLTGFGYLNNLADRIETHMPQPKPKRPEIAVDEVITITASGNQAHFAYWAGGMPCVWHMGRTSATAKAVVPVIGAIKTKDGTIWPPE